MAEHTIVQQFCWKVSLLKALKIWCFSHFCTSLIIILCFSLYDRNRIELLGFCEIIYSGVGLTSFFVLILFIRFIVMIYLIEFCLLILSFSYLNKYLYEFLFQDKTMIIFIIVWTQMILEGITLIPVAYCMLMEKIIYEITILLMIGLWIINFTLGAPIKKYYWEDKQSRFNNDEFLYI